MSHSNENPWHFLGSLSDNPEDHKILKLTRGEELRVINNMIEASRVSILYASSGNGKSSLINAGIIPTFRELGYATYITRPRPPACIDNPVTAFKRVVLGQLEDEILLPHELEQIREQIDQINQSEVEPEITRKFEDLLSKFESYADEVSLSSELKEWSQTYKYQTLLEFLLQLQTYLENKPPLLIVCDQFEELFVHYSNTKSMDEFVTQISEVWAEPKLNVRILFSMREDWVGSMIEFRTSIPEIFGQYFKLAPMRSKQAIAVIKTVLQANQVSYESETLQILVEDLAGYYTQLQQEQYGGLNLMRSPKDNPFIEAPALQIVADIMWRTRKGDYTPFSEQHYLSLISFQKSASTDVVNPSQVVLERYIDDSISMNLNLDNKEHFEIRDLRIDCLYAMTDGTRHRRATSMAELLTTIQSFRRGVLDDTQPVSAQKLNKILEPMITTRLVRQLEGGLFELSHDFAVRSTVSRWRQLDRERAGIEAAQKTIFSQSKSALEKLNRSTKMAKLVCGGALLLLGYLVSLGGLGEVGVTVLVCAASIGLMASGIISLSGLVNKDDKLTLFGLLIPTLAWIIIILSEGGSFSERDTFLSRSYYVLGAIIVLYDYFMKRMKSMKMGRGNGS